MGIKIKPFPALVFSMSVAS